MSYISFTWMRRLDAWMGKPIAAILGQMTKQPRSLYGDQDVAPFPEKVLCAQFIGLGSVVLSFPMLRALKEKGVRIAFWSFAGQADLIRLSGLADEVFVIRPTFKQFFPSLLQSWMAARKFKADLFVDLEPVVNFSAILGRLVGARARFGFLSGRAFREKLFTHLVSISSERHRVENNMLMLRRLGVTGPVNAELPTIEDLHRLKNVLPDLPARRRILININPGDLSHARMWPEDHWVDLCNRLLEDLRVDLIFPGAQDERSRVQALMARLRDPTRVFNVAGTVTLAELLRIMRDAHLVVSVESGIMHLAAWVNAPLVALFGPETPNLHAPISKNSRTLWAALPCSPCVNIASGNPIRCGNHQCMAKLTPELVYQACVSVRQKSGSPDNPRVA